MRVWSRLKWTGFAAYVGLFLAVPLALLWGTQGAGIGLGAAAGLLVWMRAGARRKIASALGAERLSAAEFPQLSHWIAEYCRRLGIQRPALAVIESPAINAAVYGFSRHGATLVLTRGALTNVRRDELAALVGRELTFLWTGDVVNNTWLSAFLGMLEGLVKTPRDASVSSRGRSYPFSLLMKQTLLYPLTLVPTMLLISRRDAGKLDLQSIQLAGKPRALAEVLRYAEAMRSRSPLYASFSTRHLFLLPPPTRDALARVFFRLDPVEPRIVAIESLRQVVGVA